MSLPLSGTTTRLLNSGPSNTPIPAAIATLLADTVSSAPAREHTAALVSWPSPRQSDRPNRKKL